MSHVLFLLIKSFVDWNFTELNESRIMYTNLHVVYESPIWVTNYVYQSKVCTRATNYAYESRTTYPNWMLCTSHKLHTQSCMLYTSHKLWRRATNCAHESRTMQTSHEQCKRATNYAYESRTMYTNCMLYMSHQSRVEWRGLKTFARRNKARVFRKLTYAILSWNLSFLQNILEFRLSQIFPLKSTVFWRSRIQHVSMLSFHLQFLALSTPPAATYTKLHVVYEPRTMHTSHELCIQATNYVHTLACCIRGTNYVHKEACCIRVTNSVHKLAVLQPFITSSLPKAISSHVTNWRVTNYVHELATWRLESYNLSSLAPSPQRFRAMYMSHELCIPVTNYVSESRTMYTRHELTSHGLCTRTTYTSHELCEWTCELAYD